MTSGNTWAFESIDQIRAERDSYINEFRIHGTRNPGKAAAIEEKVTKMVDETDGKLNARALFELATLQRLTNRFKEAIQTYERTVKKAKSLGLHDLSFDAWLGIARSHAYGTLNHGAAAVAFEQAVDSAGDEPTPKQRYEMSGYRAQLQAGRGELEAALLSAIDAIRFAQDDAGLFYAQLDTGDVLQKFAESCDYRKLIDAKTFTDGEDSWGACRRAVAAANSYYSAAKKTAQQLGWMFLANQADGFIRQLGMRKFLIDQKASFEKLGEAGVFTAQNVDDVLVNEDFGAGASELTNSPMLATLIDAVAPESQAADARSIYLRGLKADLDGQPEKALAYFQRAAQLLNAERSSFFDPRRRGTVIENRMEIVRDLAIRFLAFGQVEDAFLAFESIRSRGLGQLTAAYEKGNMTDDERNWLARLIFFESQVSVIQNVLTETTIAGIEHSRSTKKLEELDRVKRKRSELFQQPEFKGTLNRLASVHFSPPTLSEFRETVKKANIPVLLYWVTHTNVIVWVVSPNALEIKTVFLPEVAVTDKVNKARSSIQTLNKPFDQKSVRELHTYLIKPFSKYLTGRQVIIIPQGPLVNLPFEALVDAETGKFLIESMAISYAPSAAFAFRMLKGPLPSVSIITSIFAQSIEDSTQEISRIRQIQGVQIVSKPSDQLTTDAVISLLSQVENTHVLLHGEFSSEDPLQSTMKLENSGQSPKEPHMITAAELLAVDWRNARVAVFSSCEGAMVKSRISNELYGFSWALLVGGVDHVVLSRWRVRQDTNADWMEIFYKRLASKQDSPALAAATAMRGLINSGQDPYFWAGPQVFGK